jgi:pyrroline-5-carboxylate reductase
MANDLKNMRLAFIGCGVMGESMVAGLLRKEIVGRTGISASHPRENRRQELKEEYGISVFEGNADAAKTVAGVGNSAVVLCVKPQRLANVLNDLKGVLSADQLVVSIVAGATIDALSTALGTKRIVRAMPNTPSQIGAGITAWTCTDAVGDRERAHVKELLAALGKELFVETENMIDMATSLSATGPTYIFMVMEALTDAGVHLGFSRDMAKELVQENYARIGAIRNGIAQASCRAPQYGDVARRHKCRSNLPNGKRHPAYSAFKSGVRCLQTGGISRRKEMSRLLLSGGSH